jgi:alkanesulfonate monooxygenase SsuD/methylene tetrahydromethanopterin reductase-like flavin-dependent oxidoreductase (luciferase family)
MSSSVVVRPTEREALDYLDYYAVHHADVMAVASLLRDPELPDRLRALQPDERRAQLRRMVAGSFNMQILVGTPEQLVDRLLNLSRAGVDGLNMTFVNYQDELSRVIEQVMPLMEQAGLRRPHAG